MLIDLQKAFDTINHKILINKIKFLGFSENVILWFKSDLSYRKFKVKLNKYFSKAGQLLCRVPWGTILGPLLLFLYINGKLQSVKCELLLCTDDTCLIFLCSDINVIEIQRNKNISLICDWFVDNNLSILVKIKLSQFFLAAKVTLKKASPLNIQYKGKKFRQHLKVTYLGYIFDKTLSREAMATHFVNKVNSKVRFHYCFSYSST